MKVLLMFVASLAFLGLAVLPASAETLSSVRAYGQLRCGVSKGLPGFSSTDDSGLWNGIDVDICRAVAAAIFADPNRVEFVPLSSKDRFDALRAGKIDILSRNTTWTLTRDAGLGFNFAGVAFYDGQGFMVPKNLGVSSVLELSGTTICVQMETTSQSNVADFFQSKKLPYDLVTTEGADETLRAYETSRCNVVTSDTSQLFALRLRLANPDDHMVLPEIISKEPLGPLVRHGDDQWFNLVKWTLFALINGEELQLTMANADQMKRSLNPQIQRFLGRRGEFGKQLGLDAEWAYRIIKMVGNYGEVFERNVGGGSPLMMARGMNNLWGKGGIHYAPPIR